MTGLPNRYWSTILLPQLKSAIRTAETRTENYQLKDRQGPPEPHCRRQFFNCAHQPI